MILNKGSLSLLSLHAALALASTQPQDSPNQETFAHQPVNAQGNVNTGATPMPESLWHSLGKYAPYFPAGKYSDPPKGCHIVQVGLSAVLSSKLMFLFLGKYRMFLPPYAS